MFSCGAALLASLTLACLYTCFAKWFGHHVNERLQTNAVTEIYNQTCQLNDAAILSGLASRAHSIPVVLSGICDPVKQHTFTLIQQYLVALRSRYLRDNITELDQVIINSAASLMLSKSNNISHCWKQEIHDPKWFSLAVHFQFFTSKLTLKLRSSHHYHSANCLVAQLAQQLSLASSPGITCQLLA